MSSRESPNTSRLNAVQGSQDERRSRTDGTVSERETPADAVMLQESARLTAQLANRADDGGAW